MLNQFLELSTGTGKVRVPWEQLQKAQGDYIEPKYLPKGVVLKQYYHLRQKDVSAILKHWTGRQAAHKAPFRFRDAVKSIQKNQPTWGNNDADTDMGPGEESAEDSQGNDGNQVCGGRALQGDGSSDGSTGQDHPGEILGNAAENSSKVGCLLKYVGNGANPSELVAFNSLSRW